MSKVELNILSDIYEDIITNFKEKDLNSGLEDFTYSVESYFSFLYKKNKLLLLKTNNNYNIISTQILDMLFYSLLSDFDKSINNKFNERSKEILFDENYTLEEKNFISVCLFLFKESTELYFSDNLKLNNILNKITNDELFELFEIVNKYLIMYTKTKHEDINDIDCNIKITESNPYLIGGLFNIRLKKEEENPLDEDNKKKNDKLKNKIVSIIENSEYSRFNIGYYNLLLARYYSLRNKFDSSLSQIKKAKYDTHKNCPRNGKRKKDIERYKLKILSDKKSYENTTDVKKVINEFDKIKKDYYSMFSLFIAAITIPTTTIFGLLSSTEKSFEFVVGLVLSILLIIGSLCIFIIYLPYLRENCSKNLKSERGKN